MAKPIKIAVPKPCHQDWHNMTAAATGRFCGSCQKVVTDFTKVSDREIAAKVAKDKNLCGRFLPGQLNRNLNLPQEKSFGWVAAASGVLALLGAMPTASAQTNPVDQIPPVKVYTSDNNPGVAKKVLPDQVYRTVSGVVSDAIGPIPGVVVTVENTQNATLTDIDGKFEIKAKQGDKLVASYIGMHDASYVISDHFNGIEIILHENSQLAGELVVTGGIHSHRTFFGRLFHSIGNWFR